MRAAQPQEATKLVSFFIQTAKFGGKIRMKRPLFGERRHLLIYLLMHRRPV
jgi:hypothetical protein